MIFYSIKNKVNCHWEEDLQAVRVEWFLSYYVYDEFREVLLKCLEFFKQKQAHKWIIDTSAAIGAVKPSDQEWLVTEFLQKSAQAGLKYAVTIVPKSIATAVSNQKWEQKLVTIAGVTMTEVQTLQEAKDWLKTKR